MAKLTAGILLLALVSTTSAACPADSHYDKDFDKCYKLVASSSDFMSAEISCRSIGGNLVAIRNVFENNFVAGMGMQFTSFWIGGNLLMASIWTWTSGSNGTYTNFAPGQPSDPSIYQCAAVRDDDHSWTKELCSTQKPYICQTVPNASPVGNGCSTPSDPMTTTSPTSASPSGCFGGSCDPGYTLNPDACKCYKLILNARTFRNQSVTSCQAENATLPIIRNAAENDWISSLIRNRTSSLQYPWIGLLCNSSSTDSCTWDDGSALGYSNFAPGFPANDGADFFQDGPFVYLNERNNTWVSYDDRSPTKALLCEKRGLQYQASDDFRANSTFTKKKSGHSTANKNKKM